MRGCAGRLVVDAVSGDIDVVAVADIDLSARTVSGDLEIRAGNLRKLGASTTSGDLKIAGRFSGHGPYTIETVSGDGVLAPVGDIQIEMTTIAGDLRSDLEARPEGGRGRRKLIVGSHGSVADVQLAVGRSTRHTLGRPGPPGRRRTERRARCGIRGVSNDR